MKKSIYAIIMCLALYGQAYAQEAKDPKTNPGPVDLKRHPEVLAEALSRVKNGQISYRPQAINGDTLIDLSKHPEIVKAIINDPAHWSAILKPGPNDVSTLQGKNKQVIRDIISALVQNNIVKDRSEITSFMLTSTSLTVNGKEQEAALQRQLKAKYIVAPDYVVYYGNSEKTGKGIFQRADNL
ncbi:MAG: hypothetical protein V4592_14690 [Bacteroidota bacterium]